MNLVIHEKIEKENRIAISVEGEVDVYTAPQLREKLLPLCQGGSQITVNLSKVTYIDSTGLGVLIGAYKAQRATSGKLVLTGMNARLNRLFKITNLNQIMDIEDQAGGGQL
ncbi:MULTISPECIES: STAS domain-containing protein [Thermoactinomyces]|jgi:anti-sigma B factor antagonist|uniref:Anti-sigma factor antagonist n=1 Tax=Thermoactinomyces daqus TaxID=1329516 RepID=A0A7W2AJT6_9BACL|nr:MULTISPECIES: STAS domain-containing protein [Thermoactinomyces]MBA4544139.1 STAS domain-containing protein [Thermoactinomyces daqus]MBH8599527.1 STAS domain-containing protein [Thermoactinomyces sp. CICC 10523]MBH8605446.1 STAS domain-containing protein [Thermoactinomyces sp. CICC 10522]MBH8608960.1 STAS domain-containing protein [Thermoactinomyces sp. CICC 10521]